MIHYLELQEPIFAIAPLIGAALIGGGASLLGGLWSSIFGSKSAKEQSGINFEQAKQLAAYQYDLQKQQFDYTNEYNLPKNQVKRLVDANLNPNLMYSSNAGGNVASMPSVSQPRMNQQDPMALAQYQLQIAQMIKSIGQMAAETHKLKTEAEGKEIDNEIARLNLKKEQANEPYYEQIADSNNRYLYALANKANNEADISSYQAALARTYEEMFNFVRGKYEHYEESDNFEERKFYETLDELVESEFGKSWKYSLVKGSYEEQEFIKKIDILEQELELYPDKAKKLGGEAAVSELYGNLARQGINPNDPLWARMLALFLGRAMGMSVTDIFKNVGDFIRNPWPD